MCYVCVYFTFVLNTREPFKSYMRIYVKKMHANICCPNIKYDRYDANNRAVSTHATHRTFLYLSYRELFIMKSPLYWLVPSRRGAHKVKETHTSFVHITQMCVRSRRRRRHICGYKAVKCRSVLSFYKWS